MRYRISNFWFALSLLLFVATAMAWGLSYFAPAGSVGRRNWRAGASSVDVKNTGVAIHRGRVAIGSVVRAFGSAPPGSPAPEHADWFVGRGPLTLDVGQWFDRPSRLGFDLASLRGGGLDGWIVFLPCWFVCLTTAVPVVVRFRLARRHRAASRRLMGLCAGCGYDIRATPDRCPECGASAKPAALPAT